MAGPRAFVSFDYDNDEKSRRYFIGQGKEKSPTPFVISDWSSKDRLPNKTWEQTIEEKIGRCNMVIVLVGRSTSKAGGVVKEIAMAKRKDVPVFGVYVDGAGAATSLPTGLQRNRTIAWTWQGIAGAIKQMMGEGKNKPKPLGR
jgi:antiphage defense system Thoeris ThsB-like protein